MYYSVDIGRTLFAAFGLGRGHETHPDLPIHRDTDLRPQRAKFVGTGAVVVSRLGRSLPSLTDSRARCLCKEESRYGKIGR